MRPTSWLLIALVAASLAGCAGGAGVSIGGPPRCDRTGDEDQRRAC